MRRRGRDGRGPDRRVGIPEAFLSRAGARPQRRLRAAFHLTRDGSDDNPSRIAPGDSKAHPDSATFSAIRAI